MSVADASDRAPRSAVDPSRLSYNELLSHCREQQVFIDMLRAARAAEGVEWPADLPEWAKVLTRQEAALLLALIQASPRTIPHYDLLDRLPHRDHAKDVNLRLLWVVVSRVRSKLGEQIIETVRGIGYRFGKFKETPPLEQQSMDRVE